MGINFVGEAEWHRRMIAYVKKMITGPFALCARRLVKLTHGRRISHRQTRLNTAVHSKAMLPHPVLTRLTYTVSILIRIFSEQKTVTHYSEIFIMDFFDFYFEVSSFW